ncbi:hypothetical protein G7Z17_g1542 [Cylindrodendrum hubeiense]|uniref:Uncharacterized protein n=1 Tax=Cylindrodendrum hubeiense TaxID=595255 RepID=A0A9P5HFY3_9HYPO|nr:hypothetical protein G7Z17_g1542 [Cylindrodendrum hubeiense]
MIDHRGAYALVPGNEASYTDTRIDARLHKTFACLAGNLQPMRPKRRILLLIVTAALVFFTILTHQATVRSPLSISEPFEHLDAIHLDNLAAPLAGHFFSTIGNEKTFVVGDHHAVSGNYPRKYKWIDPYSRQPFVKVMRTNGMNNNAMGRMPKGSPYDVLVIARGRNDKYIDPTEGIAYANLTVVGFFANFDPTTGQWRRAGPEPYVLNLPVWRQFPRPCSNLVNGGPADPRFIWSDAGEPLAVIGTSSRVPGVCKAVGLIDLRAAWPGLKKHLEEIGYGDIPIRFDTFTEVGKASKKERFEKNWAPFFPGPKPATRELSWFSSFIGSWRKHLAPSTWPHFASQIMHRSILKVDTALDTSSVEIDKNVVFSVSMAFLPTKSTVELEEGGSPFKRSQDYPGGYLNHGWLDDTVVVGAGLRDEAYGSVHLSSDDHMIWLHASQGYQVAVSAIAKFRFPQICAPAPAIFQDVAQDQFPQNESNE